MKLYLALLFIIISMASPIIAQDYQMPVNFTSQEDHQNMKDQLGIKTLRSGPSGNASAENHANYDQSLADPCPNLPEILVSNMGVEIETASQWFDIRRPEIAEEFEKNIYGRIPNITPKVEWTVNITDKEYVNRIPVTAKEIIGHVDNSSYPLIDVNIKMMLVIPTNVSGPVPVLMMFGRPSFPAPAQPNLEDLEKINVAFRQMMINTEPELKEVFEKYPAYQPLTRLPVPSFFTPPKPDDKLSPQERLLAAGWGYCTIDPASIQADNGAGLTKGIIGLVNKGQPR